MDKILKQISDSLIYNRGVVESRLADNETKLKQHKHSVWRCYILFFLPSLSNCNFLRRQMEKDKRSIIEYQEAEKGLESGDYEKAIVLFGNVSKRFQETTRQMVSRIVNTPDPKTKEEMLQNILHSPTAISTQAKKYRDYLLSLQNKSK